MGVIEELKSRLGFDDGWQDEYLQDAMGEVSDAPAPVADGAFVTDGSVAEASNVASVIKAGVSGVGTLKSRGSDTLPTTTQAPSGDDRYYSYESPYASGAAPSAVTKHARRPDLERASQASGSALREVPAKTPILNAQTDDGIYHARPTGFAEARSVADRFKSGQPVALDLTLVASAQRQRFIDFAAGLVYALDGQLARDANHSYLLTPRTIETLNRKAVD